MRLADIGYYQESTINELGTTGRLTSFSNFTDHTEGSAGWGEAVGADNHEDHEGQWVARKQQPSCQASHQVIELGFDFCDDATNDPLWNIVMVR